MRRRSTCPLWAKPDCSNHLFDSKNGEGHARAKKSTMTKQWGMVTSSGLCPSPKILQVFSTLNLPFHQPAKSEQRVRAACVAQIVFCDKVNPSTLVKARHAYCGTRP